LELKHKTDGYVMAVLKVSIMLDRYTIPHYPYLKYCVSGCVDWFCRVRGLPI